MSGLPDRVRVLVASVAVAGGSLLVWALARAPFTWTHVIALTGAMAVCMLRVNVGQYADRNKASMALDIASVFFMLGAFGPQWGIITAAASAVAFGVSSRSASYKVAFNVGSVTLAAWLAGVVAYRLPVHWAAGLVLAAGLYYTVNCGTVTLVLSMVSGRTIYSIWMEAFQPLSLQHGALALAGFALGELGFTYGWKAALVALPLPLLHRTFAMYAKAGQRHTQELEDLSSELITTLASIVDARDAYTFGHSTQVATYSVAIARRMGYSEAEQKRLYRSALLHDIGKVGIPERVLFKPGRLDRDEYETVKQHSTIGHEILKQIRALSDAAIVARHHHERWDGSGYPDGLTGEQTDLDSRIVAVADTLDTILSDRPYRKGATLDQALAEIDRCSGTLFDPAVVAALHGVVTEQGRSFFVNSAQLVGKDQFNIGQWSGAPVPNAAAD